MKKTQGKRRGGFSLVEMMIVLGVVGLLLAFAAPNLFSLISSSTLSGEGTVMENQLTLAQQLAVSKSADVEVRFFKFADESAAQIEEAYRGYQMYQYNRVGEMIPITEFYRIRPPVAIHEDLSTILDRENVEDTEYDTNDGEGEDGRGGAGTAMVPLGSGGDKISVEYVSFRFRPDGSTDLSGRTKDGDTWYVTLVQGEGAMNTTDPDNYVSLQINAYNGQISQFRP